MPHRMCIKCSERQVLMQCTSSHLFSLATVSILMNKKAHINSDTNTDTPNKKQIVNNNTKTTSHSTSFHGSSYADGNNNKNRSVGFSWTRGVVSVHFSYAERKEIKRIRQRCGVQ